MITDQEADILRHASNNGGRYVTGDALPLDLAVRGLLENRGWWKLAEAYALVLTSAGRAALNEWQAAQPKPARVKQRRRSRAFDSWMNYRDSCYDRIGFAEFLKEIWPNYQWRTGHL